MRDICSEREWIRDATKKRITRANLNREMSKRKTDLQNKGWTSNPLVSNMSWVIQLFRLFWCQLSFLFFVMCVLADGSVLTFELYIILGWFLVNHESAAVTGDAYYADLLVQGDLVMSIHTFLNFHVFEVYCYLKNSWHIPSRKIMRILQ